MKEFPTVIHPGDHVDFQFTNWKNQDRKVRMIFESVSVGLYVRKYMPGVSYYIP